MTPLYEIERQLKIKQRELELYNEVLKSKSRLKLLPLLLVIASLLIPFIIVASKGYLNGDEVAWLSLLTVIIMILLILLIILAIVFHVKRSNARNAIWKLSEEIEILDNQLKEYKEEIKKQVKQGVQKDNKVEEFDFLIKYKELLDKNIITQEEFNKKKEEILNNKSQE